MFEIDPPQTTNKDEVAFGFMTWRDSGTLLRIDGDPTSDHFMEAQLVIDSMLMSICINLHFQVKQKYKYHRAD